MHRAPGLAAFTSATAFSQSPPPNLASTSSPAQSAWTALSSQISQSQVDSLQTQLTQFRSALQTFALNHREDIRKDPVFRQKFTQMCASIGVDPLAGPLPRPSLSFSNFGGSRTMPGGGIWGEMLGLGDWTHELAVQVVDICVSTRTMNGGLIPLSELIRLITKLRGVEAGAIGEDDVERAIQSLEPLGAGYEVIALASSGRARGKKMVRSVPGALDPSQSPVLALAQEIGGFVTEEMLIQSERWTRAKTRAVLEGMVRDGICWVDEQWEDTGDGTRGGKAWWVMSVVRWEE